MSQRIVGIVGSPRKGMNTDTLISKVLEGAESTGAAIEKIYLNDLKIMPCQGCAKFPESEYCFFHDEMDKIFQVLEEADALVIGSPAYFGTISAQLKIIIDRSNCLAKMVTLPNGKVRFRSRLEKRKKGIFIWVANMSKEPEHALISIKLWFKYFANIELLDTMVINDSDVGEGARNKKEFLDQAFNSGKLLGDI